MECTSQEKCFLDWLQFMNSTKRCGIGLWFAEKDLCEIKQTQKH